MSTVTSAIERIGVSRIADRCGFWPSAVQRWKDEGRLPKTDLAGLTNYALVISELSQETAEPVTVEKLLQDTRAAWAARRAS